MILALVGCAGTPPPADGGREAVRVSSSDEAREVAALLANHERLATLKVEAQRREYNIALALHDRSPSDATRLNLALAMLLPNAPWRDDGRVQALLGGIEAGAGEARSPRRDLAQLLLRVMAERQRLQRDEQHRMDQLVRQLREERNRAEEMQQKIDSLRAIDREMRLRKKEP